MAARGKHAELGGQVGGSIHPPVPAGDAGETPQPQPSGQGLPAKHGDQGASLRKTGA